MCSVPSSGFGLQPLRPWPDLFCAPTPRGRDHFPAAIDCGRTSVPTAPHFVHAISNASLPDIILPISSGDIAVIILALSLRPSPNGTPGSSRRTTSVTPA
jgi:hypothetical protein